MGLFDRLSNRSKKSGGKEKIDLNEYSGMRIEVMDRQGDMLFIARAGIAWEGVLELQPITVPSLDGVVRTVPVRLRGYEESAKKAVHMEGDLVKRDGENWRVENLKVIGKDNDRAFFRQETAIVGEVMPLRQTGVYSEPCRLINVSAGGVCIQVEQEYKIGERLLLKSKLFAGWELTPLMCAVRRKTKRKIGFEYGCEFVNLNPATEDMIAKAIMEMQMRRARRE